MALLVSAAEEDSSDISKRRHGHHQQRLCPTNKVLPIGEDKTYPLPYPDPYSTNDDFDYVAVDDNRLFDDCSQNSGHGQGHGHSQGGHGGILETMFPGFANLFGGRPASSGAFRPLGFFGLNDYNPRKVIRQVNRELNRFLRPLYRLF